tara:strand:- start:257 stop:1120 length:864 start_codon:yes stop_codon:yes gene_type:complete
MQKMKTNLLKALYNLVQNPVKDVVKYYSYSNNRINQVGDALEVYVKDAFCSTFDIADLGSKTELYTKYFSYLGSQNHPPDFMINGGDAVEVKKTGDNATELALNSSYPKDKLHASSPMITQACRDAETWSVKDHLYCVGNTDSTDNLKSLWFVYGDCFVSKKESYERMKESISEGINQLDGIVFSDTKELGRVNAVDPLGLTYLRVRGVWGIKHPSWVFKNHFDDMKTNNFEMNAILKETKYLSFPNEDRILLENLQNDHFSIKKIKIKNPNNPESLDSARLINYWE